MKRHLPYLVTFPRSGSHYFDELIYKEAGIRIEKSHSIDELFDENNQKKKIIITIVRDPKDSIISYRANEQRANEQKYSKDEQTRQNIRTHQVVSEYILLHNFLYEHADYIIDFNDLVKYPEPVTKKILNLLEINAEDYVFFDTYPIEYSEDYLASSKNLPSYDKNLLSMFDFDSCYFYYNRILEKKIII